MALKSKYKSEPVNKAAFVLADELNYIHRLIDDDDGHWYVIRVDEKEQFEVWVMGDENYGGKDFAGCRVDGPQAIAFADWKEV